MHSYSHSLFVEHDQLAAAAPPDIDRAAWLDLRGPLPRHLHVKFTLSATAWRELGQEVSLDGQVAIDHRSPLHSALVAYVAEQFYAQAAQPIYEHEAIPRLKELLAAQRTLVPPVGGTRPGAPMSALDRAITAAVEHGLTRQLFHMCIECWAQFASENADGTRECDGLSTLESLRDLLASYDLIDPWGRIVGADEFGQPPRKRR